MSVPGNLTRLIGQWNGTSRLWRPWLAPVESESASSVTVTTGARESCARMAYTWVVDEKPQEGELVLMQEHGQDTVHLVFIDSWHMNERPMMCRGHVTQQGIDVRGTYAAPPGPDWSWRTVIESDGDTGFAIVMYNISPEGEETIAFQNRYRRR